MNTFNILDFGAVADAVTNNAKSIQKAIDAASSGLRISVLGSFCSP